MILYVIAVGAGLFSMVGAGVAMIETGENSPAQSLPTGVIDITDPSSSTSPLSTQIPSQLPSEISPTPAPSASPPQPPPPTKDKITTFEDTVTDLINAERAKNSCAPVRTDERIRNAARAHSADMAKQNYFSHVGKDGSSFVDRMARAGYPRNSAASENIAMGYTSPQAVVNGWMNSEGHRKNILNCSSKAVGVGLAYRGNTPYWTQDFGRS